MRAVQEVPLLGGTANRGQVVRVGDTVRRPQRPTSPATAALLGHLADVGFDGAPRHLGTDRLGREVLTYIPGEAVLPPYPAWALTDEALRSVADLLRRYHDAVEGFDAGAQQWPDPAPEPFRARWGGRDLLVSHNDTNLDNVVFRDYRAVALIDFDLASPGSRLWDVAGTARLWAPLRLDDDIDDARSGRSLERLRVLVDAYGLREPDRALLVDAVAAHHDWLYGFMRAAVQHGHHAFADYLDSGAQVRSERSRAWYATSQALRRALR